MENTEAVYLTKERLIELEEELKNLKTKERKNIANKIAEARAHGDLSENAEYDAAKEAQSHLEMKIMKIENILSRVKIIAPEDMPDGEIYILSNVKVKDLNDNEEIEYTLVSPEEADFEEDKISVISPIGKAMLGKKVGETIEVNVPAGLIKYKILEIKK
ncbi:MAG: transcription elongation factor GreA [Ignavibacteria bacterium]|nr:transcription elongation factor GreA [Ignavibacteria bacterium]